MTQIMQIKSFCKGQSDSDSKDQKEEKKKKR